MATVALIRLLTAASSFSTADVSVPRFWQAMTCLTNASTAACVPSASPRMTPRTLPSTQRSSASAWMPVDLQTFRP